MIIDSLERLSRYCPGNPGFAAAEKFLAGRDLASIPDGEYPIDGRNVFAIVQSCGGRGKKDSPLETHREYIDIQIVISGEEVIGWRLSAKCASVKTPYSRNKDIAFYNDPPSAWLPVSAGEFAVFYPEDAHAPLAGGCPVKKIIIKVRAAAENGE